MVVRVPDSPPSGGTDLRHHPAVMMVSSTQAGGGGPWLLSYGPLRGRGLGAGKTTWTGLKPRGLAAQGQRDSSLREGHCLGSRAPQQIPRVGGARGTLSKAQNTPLPLEACVQGSTRRSPRSALTSPETAHSPAATACEPAPLLWWAPRGGHACPSAAPAGRGAGGGSEDGVQTCSCRVVSKLPTCLPELALVTLSRDVLTPKFLRGPASCASCHSPAPRPAPAQLLPHSLPSPSAQGNSWRAGLRLRATLREDT